MSLSLASRLARREVRRRPVRTALVALLVAVPTVMFLVVSTVALTTRTSPEELFRREFGDADVVLSRQGYPSASPSIQSVRDQVGEVLGSNVAVTAYDDKWEPMRLADASVARERRSKVVRVTLSQPDDPVLASTMQLLEGRTAKLPGEAVLTQRLAKDWRVKVGDTLVLQMPKLSYEVVGVYRVRHEWNRSSMAVTSFEGLTQAIAEYGGQVLVDVPGGLTWQRFVAEHPDLARAMTTNYVEQDGTLASGEGDPAGIWRYARFVDGGPSGIPYLPSSTPWSSVMLIMAFAVLSVVIAAAFATSARRQLVTLGQLGANGAPASVLRASLALQGLWSGMAGLVLSFALYASFLVFGHDIVERAQGRELPSWRFPAWSIVLVIVVALVSSTLAAWLPSRTAARVSVLEALAGRRPMRNVPRRLLPVGLGLFATGTFLEFLTAVGAKTDSVSENTTTYLFTGALGGMLILAGTCCLGPVIVGVFGPIGARTGGVLRLTARSLARSRARSAAVVVGIAAFVSLGLSGSTAYLTGNNRLSEWAPAPNAVSMWGNKCSALQLEEASGNSVTDGSPTEPCTLGEVSADISDSVAETMVDAHSAALRWAVFDPAPYVASTSSTATTRLEVREPGGVVVADDLVLKTLGLSARDRSSFAARGMLWIANPRDFDSPQSSESAMLGFFDPGRRVLRVALMTRKGIVETEAHVPRDLPKHAGHGWGLIITEAKASELGLKVEGHGRIYVQDDNLKEWQKVELQFVSNLQAMAPGGEVGRSYTNLSIPWSSPGLDSGLVEALIAGGVLVASLLIVAIGLSLMAAEGKEERDVLVAIGASPRTLASLAALRAWTLTMCAVLLAIPVGLIPVSLVLRAGRNEFSNYESVVLPWRTIGLLLLVPFVAYVATRAVTVVARLARPVRMSNFAFD